MEVMVDYFPELQDMYQDPADNKWGIQNIYLSRTNKLLTGHQWKYTYYDGNKIKVISSYDLVQLREKVEAIGHEWIITNNALAIDTYKLNNELLKKHKLFKKTSKHYNNTSGVRYVYKRYYKYKDDYVWMYKNTTGKGQGTYSSSRLSDLEIRVKTEGLPWIIDNENVYNDILNSEKIGGLGFEKKCK